MLLYVGMTLTNMLSDGSCRSAVQMSHTGHLRPIHADSGHCSQCAVSAQKNATPRMQRCAIQRHRIRFENERGP